MHGAAEAEHRLQVGVEHRVPVLVLHAHRERVARDAGVVDQHVQAALGLDDGVDRGVGRGAVGDVERDAAAAVTAASASPMAAAPASVVAVPMTR